jgi:hypothetical protein
VVFLVLDATLFNLMHLIKNNIMKRALSKFYRQRIMFNSEQHVTIKSNKYKHMKKVVIYLSFIMSISVTIIACSLPDDDPVACEQIFQNIQDLKISIEEFAATSICSEEFECRSIAFGSKPCGGPWSYLIYTTSIDTLELETLVAELNERENDYNLTCGATSDCSVPNEPVSFTCEDSQCIPIF